MFDKIVQIFDPEAGAVATMGSYCLGILPGFIQPTFKSEIIFYFQVGAFSVSIIVGLLTAYNIHSRIVERYRQAKTKKGTKE